METFNLLNESEINNLYSSDENAFAARMTKSMGKSMVSFFARGVSALVPFIAPNLYVDCPHDLTAHLGSDPVVDASLQNAFVVWMVILVLPILYVCYRSVRATFSVHQATGRKVIM